MAMKLLAFHDQLIAYFAAHDEHDDFAFIDIVQGTNPMLRGSSMSAPVVCSAWFGLRPLLAAARFGPIC
jgi:hypothetical protein